MLFLDNDVRAVKEIDHIFHTQAPAVALNTHNNKTMLNSGVMLLNITESFVSRWESFVRLRYSHRGKGVREGSDQELWDGFFLNETVYQLPKEYNANKHTHVNHSDIVLKHFIIGAGGAF